MNAEMLQQLGLYDPTAGDASDRLAMLEYLAELGISTEEMVRAQQHDRLVGLAYDRLWQADDRLSLRDIAARADMPLELARTVWSAAGLGSIDVDDPALCGQDVVTFETFSLAAALFGERDVFHFTRILGSSMARLAEAAVSMFLVNVAAPLSSQGQLARVKAQVDAGAALTLIPPTMVSLFRHHALAVIGRSDVDQPDPRAYGLPRMCVGFIDLVGFTALTRGLSPSDLAGLIIDFESSAFEIVAAHRGRVVKLIGDEVMFVASKPIEGCEMALALIEVFGDSERGVVPRGGLAYGDLLNRGGDYYGPVVNAASRIAELAVPREVLVTRSVRDSVDGADLGCRFEPAGSRSLKGFDEPAEVWSLTR